MAIKAYTEGERTITNPNGYNDAGIDASKIILGIPYHARGWSTSKSDVYQKIDSNYFLPSAGSSIPFIDLNTQINTNRNAWTLIQSMLDGTAGGSPGQLRASSRGNTEGASVIRNYWA